MVLGFKVCVAHPEETGMPERLVTLITAPQRSVAEAIAEALVARHHAACVNIIPGLTSVYRWAGRIERDEEWLLIAKTTTAAYAGLEACVLELHPDELPEIVALPVTGGLAGYLAWVDTTTAGGQ